MTTPSKTKPSLKQLLSEIYVRHFCEKNQQVCIDCLKSRSNKNKFELKNLWLPEFYVLDYQNSSYVILSSL